MHKLKIFISFFIATSAGTLAGCSGFCENCPDEKCEKADVDFPATKEFLVRWMPEKDREKLTAEYIDGNVRLALAARNETSWAKAIPQEIFLNDVLPYSSIREDADLWRPVFYEKFMPLVKNCRTTTEAAETLNREIWKILGVTYSPDRDKPDQSPFHSMRIGKASCTGLSIILVDACRAVGVPARFAGCNWKHKPGNHSWVEIWDNGTWHHLGAEDAPKVDQAWFNADVVYADPNDPVFAIYATSWKPAETTFYGTWCANSKTDVPAVNVTMRYLKSCGNGEKISRLSIDLRSPDGKRISFPVLVIDSKTGKTLARGMTHDNAFDLNNHLNFAFPAGTVVKIVTDDTQRRQLCEYTFVEKDEILKLTK